MILGRYTRDRIPGPVFRLAIAYGIENASACCPAVRITALWASARPLVRHGRKRGGERWHSRWTRRTDESLTGTVIATVRASRMLWAEGMRVAVSTCRFGRMF